MLTALSTMNIKRVYGEIDDGLRKIRKKQKSVTSREYLKQIETDGFVVSNLTYECLIQQLRLNQTHFLRDKKAIERDFYFYFLSILCHRRILDDAKSTLVYYLWKRLYRFVINHQEISDILSQKSVMKLANTLKINQDGSAFITDEPQWLHNYFLSNFITVPIKDGDATLEMFGNFDVTVVKDFINSNILEIFVDFLHAYASRFQMWWRDVEVREIQISNLSIQQLVLLLCFTDYYSFLENTRYYFNQALKDFPLRAQDLHLLYKKISNSVLVQVYVDDRSMLLPLLTTKSR